MILMPLRPAYALKLNADKDDKKRTQVKMVLMWMEQWLHSWHGIEVKGIEVKVVSRAAMALRQQCGYCV